MLLIGSLAALNVLQKHVPNKFPLHQAFEKCSKSVTQISDQKSPNWVNNFIISTSTPMGSSLRDRLISVDTVGMKRDRGQLRQFKCGYCNADGERHKLKRLSRTKYRKLFVYQALRLHAFPLDSPRY